jgi:hypothetical protein
MYYNIEMEWDPAIIGVKNGVYQVELDKSSYNKETYSLIEQLFMNNDLKSNQEFPKLDYKFYFKKLKSAKKTDFISFSPYLNHCHFLIYKSILEIFKSHNIQHYSVFESVIIDSTAKTLDLDYSLFNSVLEDWQLIDFEKTVFTSGGFGNNPKLEYTFKDENEMKSFKGITKVKTLALQKHFDTTLDFFHTRLGGLFISEKLKVALEEKKVTGVKFINEIDVMV